MTFPHTQWHPDFPEKESIIRAGSLTTGDYQAMPMLPGPVMVEWVGGPVWLYRGPLAPDDDAGSLYVPAGGRVRFEVSAQARRLWAKRVGNAAVPWSARIWQRYRFPWPRLRLLAFDTDYGIPDFLNGGTPRVRFQFELPESNIGREETRWIRLGRTFSQYDASSFGATVSTMDEMDSAAASWANRSGVPERIGAGEFGVPGPQIYPVSREDMFVLDPVFTQIGRLSLRGWRHRLWGQYVRLRNLPPMTRYVPSESNGDFFGEIVELARYTSESVTFGPFSA